MSAPSRTIDQLIINSPYEEPREYWKRDAASKLFSRIPGRRPAGYIRATESSKAIDDPGIFIELPLPNKIRPRVNAWREADYPGVSGITKRLLKHWRDPEQRENRRLFFCQLEAIETLIWLTEAPASERVGIIIPSDGGDFPRLCSKMATGSGKTIVMAMLIAWQVLNKVTYPQDKRFSKNIFIVAPGLTVKSRLQVLSPGPNDYYREFSLIPSGLEDPLRQGKFKIVNWHKLDWESEERIAKRKSVDKRGALSDEAYVREVLEDMATAQNIVVINDEAHHAWRIAPKSTIKGVAKEDIEEATKWVGGLDRINRTRGILSCFDFTATPFAPTGKRSGEETLFQWIVSDFGLNDAIESGLVKTPRVVIRDDAKLGKDFKSRLYHIYADQSVKEDINQKVEPHVPLPDLVNTAYTILGNDWDETRKRWESEGAPTPPVMITVANLTHTAARVGYALSHKKIPIEKLGELEGILHIDSKVLGEAEAQEEAPEIETNAAAEESSEEETEIPAKKQTKQQRAETLRRIVDTVGQVGQPGEQIHAVISVGMLSEGWDAKTVTHIMGLRAFTSQLLCEQVVGRGLRRTSYDVDAKTGLFTAEYVNIFGVPFTFMPHEGDEDALPPPPPQPTSKIQPLPERKGLEISWPNIIRIDHEYRPELTLDLSKTKPLTLDAYETPTIADLAPVIDGKPDVTKLTSIDVEKLGREQRMQRVIFQSAAEVYDLMKPNWKANREYLLAQVIRLTEKYLTSGQIVVSPPLFSQDEVRRRILYTLNMTRIVQHLWEAIRFENALAVVPVFDKERPIRSTGDMQPWFTRRPCEPAVRSHINLCVFDSRWEASEAFELDRNSNVAAWVKNDHLGFEVLYVFKGVVLKYRPDYLIRLSNGKMLVLEVKGQEGQQDGTKRDFLREWVQAVNAHGGFGVWDHDVSRSPADLAGILQRHN
ncbi:MAG: DEAD/DEAH box helicase family protein [Acidobacteriia bacterium]|nr:DEAD/DEAH box helicase family protein [Terriglobia bacterium]